MNEGTAPADLMTCSAMPANTSVLTPGATAAATASRASATTRPAARMSRICSALLSSIRSLTVVRVPSAARRRQGRREAPRDPVDVAHAVDLHEEAALPVDVHERGRLLDVHVLAVPDDIFGVVGPALELGPALAGVQVALGRQARLGRRGDVPPEHVAGRDGGNTEVRGEPLGLGALAG